MQKSRNNSLPLKGKDSSGANVSRGGRGHGSEGKERGLHLRASESPGKIENPFLSRWKAGLRGGTRRGPKRRSSAS